MHPEVFTKSLPPEGLQPTNHQNSRTYITMLSCLGCHLESSCQKFLKQDHEVVLPTLAKSKSTTTCSDLGTWGVSDNGPSKITSLRIAGDREEHVPHGDHQVFTFGINKANGEKWKGKVLIKNVAGSPLVVTTELLGKWRGKLLHTLRTALCCSDLPWLSKGSA